jgi:EpsD family peptidyl-prolyl cis-trans isomerase
MKQFNYKQLLVVGACIALGACRFPGLGHKAPTGQVLATVDGREITMRDLSAELGSAVPSDPKARKAVEQQALQAIIDRKLLAKAAEKDGLEKTPEFALKRQRLTDALLAQSLQDKLVAAVPTPTKEEADAYVNAHTDMFAQRKIFSIEQIQARGPMSQAELQSFVPLKTLDDIQAKLTADHIDYRRSVISQDAGALDPRVVDMLVKLPANDVFGLPQGSIVEFGAVRGVKVQPFQGQAAVDRATQILRQQRTQEAVARKMQGVITQGATKVSYNPAYKPTQPAASPPKAKN